MSAKGVASRAATRGARAAGPVERGEPGVDPATYRELFRGLARIRQCEEQLNAAFAKNLVPGWIHSYVGQEACAVGVCAALRTDDWIVSTHRARGHYLAKGMPLRPMIAEVFGKATGIVGGRGGEMHAADPTLGILGGNGIVGGGIPIATGAAYSAVLDGADRVSVVFFGEGASNEGSFHESLNLAALWSLPVVFVCENNLYAEMTPWRDAARQPDVARRAEGYGVPGVVVDGTDVLAVRTAALEAVGRARAGGGPTLLELKTYRWSGHFEGDPCKYRSREEEAQWKSRDPVLGLRAAAIAAGALTEAELDAIDADLAAEVREAIASAMADPEPAPESAVDGVYVP